MDNHEFKKIIKNLIKNQTKEQITNTFKVLIDNLDIEIIKNQLYKIIKIMIKNNINIIIFQESKTPINFNPIKLVAPPRLELPINPIITQESKTPINFNPIKLVVPPGLELPINPIITQESETPTSFYGPLLNKKHFLKKNEPYNTNLILKELNKTYLTSYTQNLSPFYYESILKNKLCKINNCIRSDRCMFCHSINELVLFKNHIMADYEFINDVWNKEIFENFENIALQYYITNLSRVFTINLYKTKYCKYEFDLKYGCNCKTTECKFAHSTEELIYYRNKIHVEYNKII